MTELPIIFSGPMVRAILDGRKTRTRRIVKWPKKGRWPKSGPGKERLDNLGDCVTVVVNDLNGKTFYVACPYGGEGDRLWSRETFATFEGRHFYRADGNDPIAVRHRWTPSIHMPRVACRLLLDVTEHPDLERLDEITDEEAVAEGIVRRGALYGLPEWVTAAERCQWQPTPREAFLVLFELINGREAVRANPWVWVVKLRPAGVDSRAAPPG